MLGPRSNLPPSDRLDRIPVPYRAWTQDRPTFGDTSQTEFGTSLRWRDPDLQHMSLMDEVPMVAAARGVLPLYPVDRADTADYGTGRALFDKRQPQVHPPRGEWPGDEMYSEVQRARGGVPTTTHKPNVLRYA